MVKSGNLKFILHFAPWHCLWLGFCHVDGRKKRILAMCFVYQISFTCLKSHPKIVFLKLGFYLKMLHSYERHCFSFLHIFQVSSRFTFGLSRILFTFLVYSISPLASRLWCIIWNVCYLFKDVRLYIEMRTLSISFWIIVYAFCLDVFDCERFKCIKCTHCVHNQMNLLPKNFNKVTWIITSWLVLLKSIVYRSLGLFNVDLVTWFKLLVLIFLYRLQLLKTSIYLEEFEISLWFMKKGQPILLSTPQEVKS